MELLAAVAAFVTVFVFILAFAGSASATRTRLAAMQTPGQRGHAHEGQPAQPLTRRILLPVVQVVVNQVRRIMPATMLQRLEEQLIIAGEPMTLNGFLTLQVVSAVGFLLLPVMVIVGLGVSMGIIGLLVIAGFAAVGILLPHMWLRQRVNQRRNHIIKTLPDAFDLVTTCVEAGLGLEAALARVAEKVEGPFAEELSRTLREIGLGRPRREAMRELGTRSGVPDLIMFVNAVIQAEEMGSSVGAVLRVQSEQLRVKRRQRAEEQAYKAPIKMLFPLVLCIFPTLFLVILGPAVITLMKGFPVR